MTPRNPQRWLLAVAATLTWLVGSPSTASSQAYVPAAAPHPMILVGAYLDYSDLLLTPPSAFDLLKPAPASSSEARMIAYRAFESSLRQRTAHIASLRSRSSSESRAAKRRILSSIGHKIESLPGGVLFAYGRRIADQVHDVTHFEVDGYRLRLEVDEAVEGKLAIKVQKKLR
jgi:hypothetical protein